MGYSRVLIQMELNQTRAMKQNGAKRTEYLLDNR